MNNYLIFGGSGLLGKELQKHLPGYYPSHQAVDITKDSTLTTWDTIVNLAAYTNVDRAETERQACFETNVLGVYNLLKSYPTLPFVFISTEHVNAEGVYFQSKLIGEMLVKNLASSHLIIRTLFKPTPWPYEYAFADQMTQGDYVDVIAPLIAKEIQEWDGVSKTVYVGTGRKSMYELAQRTKPDVKPNSVNDMSLKRPADYL